MTPACCRHEWQTEQMFSPCFIGCSAEQCSAVQYSLVEWRVVQCRAVKCSAVQFSEVQCSAVQCIIVHCSILQYLTVHYSTLQYMAGQCSAAQWWVTQWMRPGNRGDIVSYRGSLLSAPLHSHTLSLPTQCIFLTLSLISAPSHSLTTLPSSSLLLVTKSLKFLQLAFRWFFSADNFSLSHFFILFWVKFAKIVLIFLRLPFAALEVGKIFWNFF